MEKNVFYTHAIYFEIHLLSPLSTAFPSHDFCFPFMCINEQKVYTYKYICIHLYEKRRIKWFEESQVDELFADTIKNKKSEKSFELCTISPCVHRFTHNTFLFAFCCHKIRDAFHIPNRLGLKTNVKTELKSIRKWRKYTWKNFQFKRNFYRYSLYLFVLVSYF